LQRKKKKEKRKEKERERMERKLHSYLALGLQVTWMPSHCPFPGTSTFLDFSWVGGGGFVHPHGGIFFSSLYPDPPFVSRNGG
jgi:hypothetical protein